MDGTGGRQSFLEAAAVVQTCGRQRQGPRGPMGVFNRIHTTHLSNIKGLGIYKLVSKSGVCLNVSKAPQIQAFDTSALDVC